MDVLIFVKLYPSIGVDVLIETLNIYSILWLFKNKVNKFTKIEFRTVHIYYSCINLSPGPGQRCSISGTECLLSKNKLEPRVVSPWYGSIGGINCDCLPSCDDAVISIVHSYKHG